MSVGKSPIKMRFFYFLDGTLTIIPADFPLVQKENLREILSNESSYKLYDPMMLST